MHRQFSILGTQELSVKEENQQNNVFPPNNSTATYVSTTQQQVDCPMEPEDVTAERNGIIRSAHSRDRAFVMFVNETTRIVSVYWINFDGKPTFYVRLLPNAVVEINTFRSHAWIFRDTITGERYQVQGESILWAQPYFTRNVRNQNEIVPARRRFQIHFPIRTLREYTLWYLMRKLRNISEDMVQQLEVPKVLKDDLVDVLHKVIAFRTNPTLPI